MSVAPVVHRSFSGRSSKALSQFISSVCLWFQIRPVFYNASQEGKGLVKQEGNLSTYWDVGFRMRGKEVPQTHGCLMDCIFSCHPNVSQARDGDIWSG